MEITKQSVLKKWYLGKTSAIKISEIMRNSVFKDTYGALFGYIGEKQIVPAGAPAAIYKTWNPEEDKTDLMPAVQVSANVEVGEFELFEAPEGEAYVAVHNGPYAGLREAHETVMVKMTEDGVTPNLTVEEYTVGPKQPEGEDCEGMDDSECVTTLYYFV